MRILFTGASSFTGTWFVDELANAGHEVVTTMTADSADAYASVRGERVQRVANSAAEVVFGCRFGDERFLEVLGAADWDLLCHHAADVTDYKSPDFDTVGAVANNTHHARDVLSSLASRGGRLLLTGSVFEGGEGAGSEGLPHFSAYGQSKALTADVFRFEATRLGVGMDKFVIPNPFGPLEEPRFTSYLMGRWFKGEPAGVRTPAYTRDNIHVSLLAAAYAAFAAEAPGSESNRHFSPSGYIESQGRFAERVAEAMRPRLGLDCALELATQTEFDEPRIRVGVDAVDAPQWDESAAWDGFASFYRAQVGR